MKLYLPLFCILAFGCGEKKEAIKIPSPVHFNPGTYTDEDLKKIFYGTAVFDTVIQMNGDAFYQYNREGVHPRRLRQGISVDGSAAYDSIQLHFLNSTDSIDWGSPITITDSINSDPK